MENNVRTAAGLPETCFSVLPSTGELILIKRGGKGYYPSEWSLSTREENEKLAVQMNEREGITAAQRMAMDAGSMFGWHVPGADPEFCAAILAKRAQQ